MKWKLNFQYGYGNWRFDRQLRLLQSQHQLLVIQSGPVEALFNHIQEVFFPEETDKRRQENNVGDHVEGVIVPSQAELREDAGGEIGCPIDPMRNVFHIWRYKQVSLKE